MAKSFRSIQAQITRLQAQADKLRAQEVKQVVGRIKLAIEHYGLSAEDLFGSAKPARAGRATRTPATRVKRGGAVAGRKLPPKFADGDNTWTGRGNQPRWLVARIAEGKSLEDFRIAK